MFIQNNTHIEVSDLSSFAHISKKYVDQEIEINVYHLKKSISFYFSPPDHPKGYKIYTITKGNILEHTSQKNYSDNDIIVLKAEDDHVMVDILEDTIIHLTVLGQPSFCDTEKHFDLANKMGIGVIYKEERKTYEEQISLSWGSHPHLV